MMAIITGLALMLLAGRRPGVGRILVTFSEGHGLHVGDLPVIGAWALGIGCGVWLLREARSGADLDSKP